MILKYFITKPIYRGILKLISNTECNTNSTILILRSHKKYTVDKNAGIYVSLWYWPNIFFQTIDDNLATLKTPKIISHFYF